MKCDFCSGPKPTWKYPCEDFVLAGTVLGSDGAWAACDECASLIEQNDRKGLAARCLETFHLVHPDAQYLPRRSVRKTLEEIHRYFFRHRDGSVERIG
jgi:hypothetical protein